MTKFSTILIAALFVGGVYGVHVFAVGNRVVINGITTRDRAASKIQRAWREFSGKTNGAIDKDTKYEPRDVVEVDNFNHGGWRLSTKKI